jgi:hypothetical protein
MALLRGTLLPALTGGKELTEKSQSGEFEVPQNPESPIVCPTWRRIKQSAEADLPHVEGEIMAMTQELRHPKGIASYLWKKKLHWERQQQPVRTTA